jgi:phosphatidylinositol alpha-1,6-mannosyltransferase
MSIDRVLIITPRVDGDDGVSEVSRQAISACAAAYGISATDVWTLEGGEVPGLPWPVRSAGGSRSRLATWALRAATRRADGMLVLVMHLHLAPIALPLALRSARTACFLHGIEAWRPLRPRERTSVASAALMIANSRWTAEHFRAANPDFAARHISICPLGLRDAPAPDYPDCHDYALIVGRLAAEERYKGHELLIDLWPAVVERAPAAQLVIVGDGDDRSRLEARALERGVADRIQFAGRVSDERREGFYRNAAFFVMPSTGEGFGLAYLEAMRAGKPCIAGPGAPEEIVEHGTTGYVVDPAARHALTSAIATLFADAELRGRFGRGGAARVSQHFMADHFAKRLIAQLAMTAEAMTT